MLIYQDSQQFDKTNNFFNFDGISDQRFKETTSKGVQLNKKNIILLKRLGLKVKKTSK